MFFSYRIIIYQVKDEKNAKIRIKKISNLDIYALSNHTSPSDKDQHYCSLSLPEHIH